MKRILRLLALLAAVGVAGLAGWELQEWFGQGTRPPEALARNEAEARVLRTIAGVREGGGRLLGVRDADGRLMRQLVETAGARNVVEIGTSTGYSALWLSLGLQRTGGRLTTFEIDPKRAETARNNFRQAGVEGLVTVVVGDAHEKVADLREPIDLVFLDADKDGYIDYLNKLLPLVRPGGLILAHNLNMVPEYYEKVKSNPALDTVLFMHGGEMSITLKKL